MSLVRVVVDVIGSVAPPKTSHHRMNNRVVKVEDEGQLILDEKQQHGTPRHAVAIAVAFWVGLVGSIVWLITEITQ